MPLYDCMLLLKPQVSQTALLDLVCRVGRHVYARNGVVTELKSFGSVQLGYGIKKLDGRFYQGKLMQMTMMATPNINKELHYLNKEDRLLRWILVKHRDVKFDSFGTEAADAFGDSKKFRSSIDEDVDDDYVGEPDDDEYEIESGEGDNN